MSMCDSSHCHLIDADSIRAFYHSSPFLTFLAIEAQGSSECPQCVQIVQAPMPIEPPEFNLQTCACPAIGVFPYKVRAVFRDLPYTQTIVVRTASGAKTVKVEPIPALEAGEVALPAPPADDEVVGYAPNSTDVSRAIADAVSKLREKFPGGVNARVTETGFFAVGTPIGIAALYVRMQQQTGGGGA